MNENQNFDRNYSIWQLRFMHPKFFGVWLFIAVLFICAWLPWKVQLKIGEVFGSFLYLIAKKRRHVVEVNIGLCFSELSANEQKLLVKNIFQANAIGYMETAIAWFRKIENYTHRVNLVGQEHLEAARSQGKGVLLVGAHFSMLDLAGALTSLFFELNVTYRPLGNELMNEIMMQGRQRFCTRALHKKEVKSFIQILQEGHVLWYAADQDYGKKNSTFVDFFGVPTATITSLTWLSESSGALVCPYSYVRRKDNSGWELKVYPPLSIPSENINSDAQEYSDWLESVLKVYPEQYLWLHKRFKSRPNESDPSFY